MFPVRLRAILLAISFLLALLIGWLSHDNFGQRNSTHCGQQALRQLLQCLGIGGARITVAIDQLGPSLETRASQLALASARIGVELHVKKTSNPMELPTPYIAWLEEGHFVVVSKSEDNKVTVLDSNVGNREFVLSVENFRTRFGGIALCPDLTVDGNFHKRIMR